VSVTQDTVVSGRFRDHLTRGSRVRRSL